MAAAVEAAAVGRAPACVELVPSLDIGATRGRCGEGRQGEEGGEEDGDELELHFGCFKVEEIADKACCCGARLGGVGFWSVSWSVSWRGA